SSGVVSASRYSSTLDGKPTRLISRTPASAAWSSRSVSASLIRCGKGRSSRLRASRIREESTTSACGPVPSIHRLDGRETSSFHPAPVAPCRVLRFQGPDLVADPGGLFVALALHGGGQLRPQHLQVAPLPGQAAGALGHLAAV